MNKSIEPDDSLLNLTKYLKKNTFKTFFLKNIEWEGTFTNSFSEASITLIPETEKDITRKENKELVSFMNIDVKILNKILTN